MSHTKSWGQMQLYKSWITKIDPTLFSLSEGPGVYVLICSKCGFLQLSQTISNLHFIRITCICQYMILQKLIVVFVIHKDFANKKHDVQEKYTIYNTPNLPVYYADTLIMCVCVTGSSIIRDAHLDVTFTHYLFTLIEVFFLKQWNPLVQ